MSIEDGDVRPPAEDREKERPDGDDVMAIHAEVKVAITDAIESEIHRKEDFTQTSMEMTSLTINAADTR